MKVRDVMTRDVAIAHPRETIQQAARLMSQRDVGALPVADDEHLVGIITDRDMAIRAVMADIQLRRLPVVNRDKRLVGILALGDIATSSDNGCAADALAGISRPRMDGGLHPGA